MKYEWERIITRQFNKGHIELQYLRNQAKED